MAAILNSAFLDSAIMPKTLTQTNSIWLKHIYSDSTWWWQPSRILPCWIPSSLFSHLSFSSQTHSHFPRLVPTICTKKLHSFFGSHHLPKNLHSLILTQIDDGSHLEFYHVGFHHLYSAILVFPLKLTHTFQDWFPPFAQKNFTHSLVPTICPKIFTHWFWLKLMMAAILNSAILDSDTLFSSLRFTQKHSPPTLILTQTNSIWLKLIHSHSTWWWQPSWIL